MEPMTLGSPSGSSLTGVTGGGSSGYLPSFLMGDPPNTPRPNTLSPTRGRSLAYSHGLTGMAGSPPDSLRSPPMQHHYSQQHQQYPNQFSSSFMQHHTPQSHQSQQQTQRFLQNSTTQASNFANQYRNESFDANSATAGPPTQGLFDSLRKEQQSLQTPSRGQAGAESGAPNQSIAESFQNQSGFNLSRVMSPIPHAGDLNRTTNISPTSPLQGGKQDQAYHNWVTVFGFSQNAVTVILTHFIGVGTIVEKQLAPQGGNWIHLRYSSRIECDRAVNYNGRIISPGLMIGVQHCTDPVVLGKENDGEAAGRPQQPIFRVRSLMNVSYSGMQQESAVVPSSPLVHKRGNGIVNKAMDLIFGW